ncbi:MAG: DUF4249 domain-containing protein, partial [Cytophagaceae bacterium]|nr:DUF4249 domain-containing protein [Cytophagaceae bacterium]
MSIKSTLSLLLFALLAVACRDSTTFDLPTSPPLPVLNAVLMAGEIPEVYVCTSWNATGPIPANAFSTDAIVTLFENDSLLGTLSHTGKGMYRLPSVRLKAGRRYVFKVSTPDGAEAENQPVMVPMDPPVQRVWLDREAMVSGLNGTRNKPILLRVALRDDLSQERYYGIAIEEFWKGYTISGNSTPVEVSNASLQYRDDDCFRQVGLAGNFALMPLQPKTAMLVYGNGCITQKDKELRIVVETFGTVQSHPLTPMSRPTKSRCRSCRSHRSIFNTPKPVKFWKASKMPLLSQA